MNVPAFVTSWMQLLENSSLAVLIRQSLWLYPVLEIIHIIGIVLLVGVALMFDIRLLGFSKTISVEAIAHHLLPWSHVGLYLVVPSGILLFITNAISLSENFTFWLKMTLLLMAGVNVYLFHLITFRTVGKWKEKVATPVGAKVAAFSSILLWLAIICCGRFLAY